MTALSDLLEVSKIMERLTGIVIEPGESLDSWAPKMLWAWQIAEENYNSLCREAVWANTRTEEPL